MLDKIFGGLKAKATIQEVSAHCDIPCKIYDPITAQIAALTVVRLVDIMEETQNGGASDLMIQNTISRCIFRKEEEAEKVKHEIRIIWGDYFKQPQFEKFPGVNDLVHEIMRTASGCKQEPTRATGEALVQQVNQFAEMFWATKEVETTTLPCPYPPSLPTVYPLIN